MKKVLLFGLLTALLLVQNLQPVTMRSADPPFPTQIETVPTYIPAVAEDVFTANVHITEITLSNNTDSAVTVTISDKQASPLPVFPTVSIAARTAYEINFSGRYCPNGVSWVASTPSAVVGYMRGFPK